MATLKVSNFASTVMATALLNPGDTTLAVTATTGALFPTLAAGEYFIFVMVDSLTAPTKREVIYCTARSGDTFTTLLRAQEGTIAQTWIAGNYVIERVTKGTIEYLQAVVPGSFEARLATTTDNAQGDALVGFRQANASGFLTSSVGTTVSRKFQDTYSQIDFGIVGDGVTDDSAALNAAYTVLASIGPAAMTLQGNLLLNSAVTIKTGVYLYGNNAKATWGGGATPMFTSASTGVLANSGIYDLNVTSNTASVVFDLKSPYNCKFDNIIVTGNSLTSTILDLNVNTSGGTNQEGNRNAATNVFRKIHQLGTCGRHTRQTGQSVSAVCTLNTFSDNQAGSCAIYGVENVQWADNNTWDGNHRYGITAVGAIGWIENTGSPTTNVGVYRNIIAGSLAVDALGGPFAGRIGIYLNNCSQFQCAAFYQDPVAEGGQYVVTQYAHGYKINLADAGGVGATEITDNPYVLYNAYNGAGNYMRLWVRYVANEALIYTDNAGTGVAHPLKFGVNGSVQWAIDTSGHFTGDTDNTYDIGNSGAKRPRNIYPGTSVTFPTGGQLAWSTDLFLLRDAANTSAQRNGTNAQLHKLYNTYSSAGANYERLNLDWITNDCIIYTSAAGTGATRALKFGVAGAAQWGINTSGHWVADTTNTYDIGTSAGNKPRSAYLATDIYTGNTAFMHRTTAALANGAGAGAGTIANAPAAGNPTKWIPIDDNGTTRYIPAW